MALKGVERRQGNGPAAGAGSRSRAGFEDGYLGWFLVGQGTSFTPTTGLFTPSNEGSTGVADSAVYCSSLFVSIGKSATFTLYYMYCVMFL